jgi:hypothetical protein
MTPKQKTQPGAGFFFYVYLLVMTYMATQPGIPVRVRRRWRKPSIARNLVMALNLSNFTGYCNR